jgi:hypothetical protein
MTLSANQASQIIIQEINLSQVVTSASTSVVAQVIVSNQGSTTPLLFTNAQDYLGQYGNPDPQISFDVYCGLDFFKNGNQLWGMRVAGTGALYAALLMWTDGTLTYLTPITAGVTDPTEPDWTTLLPAGETNEAIALFYPALGPGSYADTYALQVVSSNIAAPEGFAVTTMATGGILPAATYQYQISALNANGETMASNAVTAVIAGAGTTYSNVLTWDNVPYATGYKIYGNMAGDGYGLMATIGAGTLTFTDTGDITPEIAYQPIMSPADAAAPVTVFTVNVFNTLQSTSYPVESWQCSLTDYVNSQGMETELEQAINPFSQYIQVTSNVPALMSTPAVDSVALTTMAGGDSGALPTTDQIAAAWATFSNTQLYSINLLMNSGHSDPTVQLAMDTLAQGRGDCVSMLDVPSASQAFQDAINYRNLTLNLNSTYSALFAPDMLEADTINGTQVYVPFSGWATSLCAKTDAVANPSYSIAGLNRGLVSVLGTRYSYDLGEMNALFQAQVNYTQTFVGSGTALWEQQTLSTEFSALSWISVRRIINVIKVALYKYLLYSLQEPNDQFLGNQIVGSCSAYLQTIQNAQGISSFEVVSDTSNNTAQDFNSGIRNVTIIIVPMIPVHIINLQVVVSQQGVSFTEALSQVTPG